MDVERVAAELGMNLTADEHRLLAAGVPRDLWPQVFELRDTTLAVTGGAVDFIQIFIGAWEYAYYPKPEA